jgi:hypothetical protein
VVLRGAYGSFQVQPAAEHHVRRQPEDDGTPVVADTHPRATPAGFRVP